MYIVISSVWRLKGKQDVSAFFARALRMAVMLSLQLERNFSLYLGPMKGMVSPEVLEAVC